jgi:hypothetical protein
MTGVNRRWIVGAAALSAACLSVTGYLAFGSSPPPPLTVDVIQSAYEAEAANAVATHIAGLRLTSTDCVEDDDGGALCWIEYTQSAEPAQRNADVVTLRRAGSKWKLASGLCLPKAATKN